MLLAVYMNRLKKKPLNFGVFVLVTAGAVAGICIGSIVFLIGISIIAYRCYQRRRARNVQTRLSYAIKKGLKESTNGRRTSSSVKSTPLKQHRATSPILPPQDSILDRSSEQGYNMPPENGQRSATKCGADIFYLIILLPEIPAHCIFRIHS